MLRAIIISCTALAIITYTLIYLMVKFITKWHSNSHTDKGGK